MLGENIKAIRKRRGFTQEELAIRLNVVRQTVSKWEKNISVPDASLLQKLAEVLDVPVTELLGEPAETGGGQNEIAEQLSRVNEQLAIKNRRARRIWTVIAVICGAIALFIIAATVLSIMPYGYIPGSQLSVLITENAEAPLFTHGEIESAAAEVRRYFRHNFEGCALEAISYDEDHSRRMGADYAEQYGEENVIVLTSRFTVGHSGGDGSFSPDTTYEGWSWILLRDGAAWRVISNGYG